jgi:hypothetical protein
MIVETGRVELDRLEVIEAGRGAGRGAMQYTGVRWLAYDRVRQDAEARGVDTAGDHWQQQYFAEEYAGLHVTGMVLITDPFFHSVQRIYGNDNDPEAGGALIDVQTLLSPMGSSTSVCSTRPRRPGLSASRPSVGTAPMVVPCLPASPCTSWRSGAR